MFRSFPKCKRKFHKNSKNIQKIEKYHYDFIPSQNMSEKAENERKLKLSLRFVPSRRGRENSKKIAKKFKNLKLPLWLHSKPKLVGKFWENERIKIITSFGSFPKGKIKFHKNSKNIQKIEKYHYGLISSPNRMEKAEKERK